MRNILRNDRIFGNFVSSQINEIVIRVERLRKVCACFPRALLASMSSCCFQLTKQHRWLRHVKALRHVVVG